MKTLNSTESLFYPWHTLSWVNQHSVLLNPIYERFPPSNNIKNCSLIVSLSCRRCRRYRGTFVLIIVCRYAPFVFIFVASSFQYLFVIFMFPTLSRRGIFVKIVRFSSVWYRPRRRYALVVSVTMKSFISSLTRISHFCKMSNLPNIFHPRRCLWSLDYKGSHQ